MNEPAVRRSATYQDILDAPPNMVAELVNGALRLHPRPAPRHSRAQAGLLTRLDDAFGSGARISAGWILLIEPELHLDANVLVPDLAAWRRARMPAFPDAAFIELAPDWLCEVTSPATRRLDREKRDLYARAGVEHLWLVDPLARTLEAFVLRGGAWTLAAAFTDKAEVRAAPFDALAFPLSVLWPD